MNVAISEPAPTVSDVARICAITNRVIRNLEITACYAQLSDAMRARTGDAANWCTFATWASRQAGSTIRGEDLLERFERRLGGKARVLAPFQSFSRWLLRKGLFEPDTRLGRLVAAIHTPFDAFERSSDAVAQGNLKVFQEIGREFARFIATVPADVTSDSPAFAAFAAELRPGPSPDGQDLLKEAFAHYQRQREEEAPLDRAARLLLANVKVGLHEQIRLQPQITRAVDAPLTTAADLGTRVLHLLVPGSSRWPKFLHSPAVTGIGWLALTVRRAAVNVTREVVTESLMVLALPGAVLSLGRNLDAPLPPVFVGAQHPELDAFIREYDSCEPGAITCAAADWCDLHQRMHYIVHLFRAYAVDGSLFAQPFTLEQVARFRAQVVPDGDL
jgi:hypothetical protein